MERQRGIRLPVQNPFQGGNKNTKFEDLDSRQEALEKYLKSNGQINRAEYQSLTGVSSATACRDLQAMIDLEFILKKGAGRTVKYLLKSGGQGPEKGLDAVGLMMRRIKYAFIHRKICRMRRKNRR